MAKHTYESKIEWTGNKGSGTFDYRSYSRSHTISIENKADILASSDSSFRGDETKHNPEDLFVSSLAGCHMLWYLHLCADEGIVVVRYSDNPVGTMIVNNDVSGYFEEVLLRPRVVIAMDSDPTKAESLHKEAHQMCFLANSCKFPIRCEGIVEVV